MSKHKGGNPAPCRVVSREDEELEVVSGLEPILREANPYSDVPDGDVASLQVSSRTPYRIYFSIADKNRSWIRGSKRTIRWVFGFANGDALRRGSVGRFCRGEEHEVELVFSKKSGKIKVYWNKKNISSMRQSDNGRLIDFCWKLRSGETIQVVAHPEKKVSVASEDYDLIVDDASFSKMATVAQLGRNGLLNDLEEYRSPQNDDIEQLRMGSFDEELSRKSDSVSLPSERSGNSGFRLSMAGLHSIFSLSHAKKGGDELYSEMYSPVLESLRQQIIECLPQTEDIVSRAIMTAFSLDSSSMLSMDSISTFEPRDPYQTEADHMLDAYRWTVHNSENQSIPDLEEQAMLFFQKRIEEIFLCIRNEELSSDQAARIVLSVASVLGLKFEVSPKHNTVLVNGHGSSLSKDNLYRYGLEYGEVQTVAIARLSPSFGFCRFIHEAPAVRIVAAHQALSSGEAGYSEKSFTLLRVNRHSGLHPLITLQPQEEDYNSLPPPQHANALRPDCVSQLPHTAYESYSSPQTYMDQNTGASPMNHDTGGIVQLTIPQTAASF